MTLDFRPRSCCLWTFERRLLIFLILNEINRLSVSNCVSPGPRSPIPPFCLSKCVQPLTSRVERCFNWASSTCSFPSNELALNAKISRIRPVLSITWHFNAFSKFRSWDGDNCSEKITSSISFSLTSDASSSTLPVPIKNCAFVKLLLIVNVSTIFKPDDSASC